MGFTKLYPYVKVRSNPNVNWAWYSTLIPARVGLKPGNPDFDAHVEDLLYFRYGHRVGHALSLVQGLLEARGLRLLADLGTGAFGAAYLASNGNVVKLTTSDKEFAASKKLRVSPVEGVVKVYDTLLLGSERSWNYYYIETELLRPTGWPEGRNVPAAQKENIRRACAEYFRVTGFRCDAHSRNFGLNEAGNWVLLDVGPADDTL